MAGRFLLAALPWAATAVTLGLVVLAAARKSSGRARTAAASSDAGAWGRPGLCCAIGLSGGIVIGGLLGIVFGSWAFSWGICLGTLFGAIVGKLKK